MTDPDSVGVRIQTVDGRNALSVVLFHGGGADISALVANEITTEEFGLLLGAVTARFPRAWPAILCTRMDRRPRA